MKLFSLYGGALSNKCDINTTIQVDKPLNLTMTILDIDYKAFIRRPIDLIDWTFETPNSRFKLKNKIKHSEPRSSNLAFT